MRGRRVTDYLMKDFMKTVIGVLSLGAIIYGMLTGRL